MKFEIKYTGTEEWVVEEHDDCNKVSEIAEKMRQKGMSGKARKFMGETMSQPKVHNKHSKTAPPGAVYIGRPSKWGNPFEIGKDGTREEVVAKYKQYILGNAELLAQLPEIKGKDLTCFCAPQACHGDVLLQLANNTQEETVTPKQAAPLTALVKLEKLSPEEVAWITSKLEEKILPHLQSDVSNYAKGRQRVWLPYEAPLGNQPFMPGLMDDEVWQWIVDRCAKHGFKAQVALISKGGNIKPHRDTTYAAPWAMGFNLGKCDWHIASDRQSAKPDFTMSLNGGEVFKFNSKHVHAVTDAASDRWAINVWAIATGPAADNANISARLTQMLDKNPEVQEFIELHQPGASLTISRKETIMNTKFVIAGTGTRQLINEPKEYRHKVLNYLVELLEGAKTKYGAENVEVISGMAEGFDEALARAAVIANVPFTAALPTGNYVNYYWCQAPLDKDGNIVVRPNGRQDPKGSRTGRNRLNAGLELLGKATKVVHVCKSIYEELNGTQLHANYIRNQWMVDRADIIWAYNPTGDGGTQDCVNRAIKADKRIFNIVVPKDDGGDDLTPAPDNPEGGSGMKENASFKGTFLSNFWPAQVEHNGIVYPTVENFYQAMKTKDLSMRVEFTELHPAEAKKKAKAIKVRDDWNPEMAEKVMLYGLRAKFVAGSELAQQLLATGDQELIETNYWHDMYWGKCTCSKHNGDGKNRLGILLMQVRDELKNNGGGDPDSSPNNPEGGPVEKNENPETNLVQANNEEKEVKVSSKAILVDKWTTTAGLNVELKRSENNYQIEAGRAWFAVVDGKVIYPTKKDRVIDELTAKMWLHGKNMYEMPSADTLKVDSTEKKENTTMTPTQGGVMLNDMQAKAFDLVVNGSGNVLLTGNAGTGKSFLTNLIVETMQARGKRVLVTATTGIAATHINGGTYHSILRILPIYDINENGYKEMSFEMKVKKTVKDIVGNKAALDNLKHADLIIVDEISMMHKVDFGRIDHAFREIFNPSLPFGGKRFLFVGDFLQIEPVEKSRTKKGPFFAYATKAWANANIEVVQLTKIVRQQDVFFAAFLNNVRQAIMSKATEKVLLERIAASYEGVDGLIFFSPTNKEVDEINQRMMAKIESEEFCYTAIDTVYHWQRENYWDTNCLAPRILKLKVGAQVINLKNDAETGLVNGDVGVVTELTKTYAMVHFYRLNGLVRIDPAEFHQGDPNRSSRIQLPIKPAWALSIHKSQGMTLDKVCISFGNAFASGQVYVALSRVRSLEGLFINEANFDKIKADPSALDFYGLVGNVKGADAEKACHIGKIGNDNPDDEGGQFAVIDPNPNNDNSGGSNGAAPTEKEEEMNLIDKVIEITQETSSSQTLDQTMARMKVELQAMVEKNKEDRMIRLEKMKGGNMWVELLVQDKARDLADGLSTISRIITNDPSYWLAELNVEVLDEIDLGGYHYALLDHIFKGESVCAQVTSFKHPEKTDTGEEVLQKVAVRRATKPRDVIFGFADFDAEYLIRVNGYNSDSYSTMEEYGLKIGNSSKMIKRLVELFKKSPGYKIHTDENRFSIKVVTYEDLLKAFPDLKNLEKAGKTGDGINIGAISTAKYIYRGSKHLSKAQKGRILRGIDNGEYMNHTVRILTNINGVAGLIKGNMILGDMDAINQSFRDVGIIGEDEKYEIFTTPDNFKEEFGTDGSFEMATLDPHHGPGPVKTNDQMYAQYMDVRGMCNPDELLDAFQKYLDKAYNNIVDGKDIQYLDKIHADHPDTEAERIAEIRGSKITTTVNKMVATLNELDMPLSVSQTMMLQRANLITKMFLAESNNYGERLAVGENWKAPSKAKKSFVFMPWAYWAYILPKEILYLAGYDIDLVGEKYNEAEYHEATGTILVPGSLYDEIMARLGGGDGDDRVMVHIRKMIMKDGSVRFVAVLIRTPNDWSEYWIIDVDIDNYGPVFVADDLDVEMPTIYEEDFDKFKTSSVCGQLPSAVNGSNRPTPAIWDWESTRYNYAVFPYTGTKVGGQVKTKMLQYSTCNMPFETLPCANEDMIDAIQQCKGDVEDMKTLNEWSIQAIANLVLYKKLDAYWWHSRNMHGTVMFLKKTGVISKHIEITSLSAANSPIVRDLMVPREEMIRETFTKMRHWLNHNITEIPELSICISRQTEDKYKALVTGLNRKFNGTLNMSKEERSAHFDKAAREVMAELNKYKEENTEEEFLKHILRLVRMSYLMKKNAVERSWNQSNPNNNYDRWLFTALSGSDVIPTDYFYQAMIWFRDVFLKK